MRSLRTVRFGSLFPSGYVTFEGKLPLGILSWGEAPSGQSDEFSKWLNNLARAAAALVPGMVLSLFMGERVICRLMCLCSR